MFTGGLTGNYGMGKSTVLEMFRDLGAFVLDADDIVDQLLKEEPVLCRIREKLGDKLFSDNGLLDRKKIARLIFNNKEKRELLEDLLHPLVLEKTEAFMDKMKKTGKGDKIAIIAMPLLFEKKYAGLFQKTITVYADTETALKRLEQKGISREDSLMRLKAQLPVEEKIRLSDFTINNNGALAETEKQVKEIYRRLVEICTTGTLLRGTSRTKEATDGYTRA